jgi:hypothetical protein
MVGRHLLRARRKGRAQLITREQAEAIAAVLCGAPAEDAERGWELKEFDAGWLISEHAGAGRRGGATRVIERDTGQVMRFPSGIPPTLILEEYAQVRGDAHPQES